MFHIDTSNSINPTRGKGRSSLFKSSSRYMLNMYNKIGPTQTWKNDNGQRALRETYNR